ncbi:caspase family protein [Hyalangium rubrum]|uniref:Caspase family protein n=1 Tax=Hyalangium rubrum TaxID=3103134 RepID=A0ABU5HIY8_9BACT|nr:caspase family protein [Hyalangium sp. s54d21]MDY7233336.1 caspase family protein [Hyalangium sp. s54d21]
MIRNRLKPKQLAFATCMLMLFQGPAFAAECAHEEILPNRACSLDAPAVPEKDGELAGRRRLALVVGVGEYKNHPRPTNLAGPPTDADRMYRLLTDPVGGFGFPKGNVCLLKNSEASLAAFEKAFEDSLVKRAQDGDVVVVFFAGHGSQARDGNGDEPDQKDETLMLWDARSGDVPDLVDDKLNMMLGRLFKKMNSDGSQEREQNVTVILDSCNSGTATRGGENTTAQTRYFDTSRETLDLRAGIPVASPGSAQWDGEDLPGLNFISAAVDGTAAKESKSLKEGFFTTALIQVLRDSAGTALTYDQLQRRLDPLVAARSDQKVQVQGGRTNLKVFGASTIQRPTGYFVSAIRLKGNDGSHAPKRMLDLKGTPLPGWSAGAQVRIYNLPGTPGAATTMSDLNDPTKAKATGVVTAMNGVEGATVDIADKETAQNKARLESLQLGDIAMLALPGKDSVTLTARFAPPGKPGAITPDRAKRIIDAIAANLDLQNTVQVLKAKDKGTEVWTLSQGSDGNLQLFDAFGVLRSSYAFKDPVEEPAKVARNLGQHARQKALLLVKGEAGTEFKNDQTLQVQVVPLKKGLNADCDKAAERWDSTKYPAGSVKVEIPLDVCWQVRVRLADDAPKIPLYVGGVFMTADGGIDGFPSPARKEQQFITLEPGKTLEYTFKMTKRSAPPLKARDHLLVFGTREQVKWSDLTEPAATRGPGIGLQGALAAYLGGTRGADDVEVTEPNTWTSSHVALVTVANSGFKDSLAQEKSDKREFTLPHYDIREQLPANTNSALYKLLYMTAELTHRYESQQGTDGAHYNKDHVGRWEKLSDEENLDIGIECSRAIWYAFTRSGLQYNKGVAKNLKIPADVNKRGSPLSTWDMVDEKSAFLTEIAHQGKLGKSAMRDQFNSCIGDPELRPGDVLVYRRLKTSTKNDGHVVMVIDPEKSIAWGSHAFDSSAILSKDKTAQMDVGVEYQRILRAKSGQNEKWGAWDKSDMVRVECWRHKQITQEWEASPMNRPGTFNLSKPLIFGALNASKTL